MVQLVSVSARGKADEERVQIRQLYGPIPKVETCSPRLHDFNLVKNQSRGHVKKVECSSTTARTKADRKCSDSTTIAKVETCPLCPRGKATATENDLSSMGWTRRRFSRWRLYFTILKMQKHQQPCAVISRSPHNVMKLGKGFL